MKEEQQTETAFERLKANAQDDAGNGKHDSEAQIVITLQGGKLSENTTLAETAMIKAGAPLYVRHGEIVRPIIEEVRALKGRRTKTVRLRPVTADMVRDYLSRAVRFEKYDVRAKKAFAVDPPRDIANNLLGRDGLWNFRS
jgi:hypothetical protein